MCCVKWITILASSESWYGHRLFLVNTVNTKIAHILMIKLYNTKTWRWALLKNRLVAWGVVGVLVYDFFHASPKKQPIYIYIDIYICWFNFDALAQGNAYKPTKEPINYRGPGGDRTHDLQTEATPPAASCLARTLHATEIAPKNATPMTCPWLHWTTDNLSGMHMVSISTPVCVNFELRPDIYIYTHIIYMCD